jgi:hypothetical protein
MKGKAIDCAKSILMDYIIETIPRCCNNFIEGVAKHQARKPIAYFKHNLNLNHSSMDVAKLNKY